MVFRIQTSMKLGIFAGCLQKKIQTRSNEGTDYQPQMAGAG